MVAEEMMALIPFIFTCFIDNFTSLSIHKDLCYIVEYFKGFF